MSARIETITRIPRIPVVVPQSLPRTVSKSVLLKEMTTITKPTGNK